MKQFVPQVPLHGGHLRIENCQSGLRARICNSSVPSQQASVNTEYFEVNQREKREWGTERERESVRTEAVNKVHKLQQLQLDLVDPGLHAPVIVEELRARAATIDPYRDGRLAVKCTVKMMRTATDATGAAAHDELPSWQQRCEEELEKIRTEGDLALIKAHAERQSILKADEELQTLKKQLKEAKKQFNALSKSAAGAHHNFSNAAAAGTALGGTAIPTGGVVSPLFGDGSTAPAPSDAVSTQRLAQAEERLKAAISERHVELQKLRHQIDQTRRQRLEGLQHEKRIGDETRQTEDEIQQTQKEVDALKERVALLKNEIAQLQSAFDVEKQAFRIEKQQLTLEVDRITKPNKGVVKVNLPGRKSIYNNIGQRSKHTHMSKAKKMSIEQKVVSFKQKKLLLDKLVEDTSIQNLSDFIERYNEQERVKVDILARIEAKSNINSSLNEAIAHLAEDITHLIDAGDIQTIVHMEQPSELKRLIDADENQINQWSHDTQVYAETLKMFREPIRELYLELFPQDRSDEVSDSTINELSMLRRIGAIEERTMQRVLRKILHEMETTQQSETWRRLRKYQGLWKDNNSGGEDESAIQIGFSGRPIVVEPPSVRDAIVHDSQEDDSDDPHSEAALVTIHPDEFRQKQSNINKISASNSSSCNNNSVGSTAAATQAQRKHAAISL